MKRIEPAFFTTDPGLTPAQGASLARMLALLIPDAAVFTVDSHQRIDYWSPGAERLLGFQASRLMGENCLTANRCEQCMRGCGLQASGKVEGMPMVLHKADGGTQPVLKYAMAYTTEAGQFAGGLELLIPQPAPQPASMALPGLGEQYGLVSHAPEMLKVFEMIRRVAVTDIPVLIRGASGTGKELVARAIHGESRRRAAPFVAINCATLSAGMLESELFGHVRGAFTGAVRDHTGLFERAHGGTLFLDEVAEIPVELQAKLLRVLETGEYLPVGAEKPLQADVRIVTATHKALRAEVSAGRFRQDLLFRLRVVPIFLPPLQARKQDIPLLVRYFLKQQFADGRLPQVSDAAMQCLLQYDWPGNVRELRNVMHYALVMADGQQILPADLPPELQQAAAMTAEPTLPPQASRRQVLSATAVMAALAACGGNLTLAAQRLGVGRTTLWRYRKLWQARAAGDDQP